MCGSRCTKSLFEPPRDKTNKMACAPSEDTDQPRYPPSPIRVFAVRMKKDLVLSYPLSKSEDSDQTGRIPRLIRVFAGRTCQFAGFVTRRLSYDLVAIPAAVYVTSLATSDNQDTFIPWHTDRFRLSETATTTIRYSSLERDICPHSLTTYTGTVQKYCLPGSSHITFNPSICFYF